MFGSNSARETDLENHIHAGDMGLHGNYHWSTLLRKWMSAISLVPNIFYIQIRFHNSWLIHLFLLYALFPPVCSRQHTQLFSSQCYSYNNLISELKIVTGQGHWVHFMFNGTWTHIFRVLPSPLLIITLFCGILLWNTLPGGFTSHWVSTVLVHHISFLHKGYSCLDFCYWIIINSWPFKIKLMVKEVQEEE